MADLLTATAHGVYFLAEPPQAVHGAGGAFSITMRARNPVGERGREGWLHIFAGPEAKRWWEQEGKSLRKGDGLYIASTDLRAHNLGRVPEIHARVTECRVFSRIEARASA